MAAINVSNAPNGGGRAGEEEDDLGGRGRDRGQ